MDLARYALGFIFLTTLTTVPPARWKHVKYVKACSHTKGRGKKKKDPVVALNNDATGRCLHGRGMEYTCTSIRTDCHEDHNLFRLSEKQSEPTKPPPGGISGLQISIQNGAV